MAGLQQLGGSLTAQIEPRNGGTSVALKGNVTEAADFTPLKKLGSPLRIDLSGVDRLNSLGVRGWVNFVRDCEAAGLELSFERCSPVIVQQISMISNFIGARSRVTSMFVPYLCPKCNNEDLQLLEVTPGAPLAVKPSTPCLKCGTAMELDEPESMYAELFAKR